MQGLGDDYTVETVADFFKQIGIIKVDVGGGPFRSTPLPRWLMMSNVMVLRSTRRRGCP